MHLIHKNGFWIRIHGYGLYVIDRNEVKPPFSVRNGHRRELRAGKWGAGWLSPSGLSISIKLAAERLDRDGFCMISKDTVAEIKYKSGLLDGFDPNHRDAICMDHKQFWALLDELTNNKASTIGAKERITASDVSVGMTVKGVGKKWIYSGKLFNPLTWLKFEEVSVIEPCRVDHAAIVGVISAVISEEDQSVKIKLS